MKVEFNKFNEFYLEHKNEADALISKVLESGQYIRSKNIEVLENNLAKLCNRKFIITNSSCTDAIFLALKTIDLKPKEEVILPSFSYIASLSPILMCGAKPVFVDINKESLTASIDSIYEAVTEKTKAIIFVQLFGNIIELSDLHEFCLEKNIVLSEDAAQSIGAKHKNFMGASQGDLSCLSFDPTKIISAFGTGGAVLTNNEKYFNKLKKLIHHGRNENGEFEILGYNSKISEINASLINIQLQYLDKFIAKNNELAKIYFSYLKNIPQIKAIKPPKHNISNFHKFVILATNRNDLKKYLYSHGIETKIHYSPLLHEHKLLNSFDFKTYDLQNSEYIKEKVLSLPIYPNLEKEKIQYICQCIKNFYEL